jgi:hypothetical protein
MRKLAAGLVLVCLLAAIAVEVASYLPFDPEWTVLAAPAVFASTFLVGALGAFFMAPELVRIRNWPPQLLSWLKWVGIAWGLYTLLWFALATFLLPGIPTHCGTLGQPACGDTYVFNSHGFLTVTDRAGFLEGVRIGARGLAGPPIAVLSLILVAFVVSKTRAGIAAHRWGALTRPWS